MNIQYYGMGCFKLSTSGTTVLFDPFDSKIGLSAPRGQVDIALFSAPWQAETVRYPNAQYTLDRPGEVDIATCSIVGLPSKQPDGIHTIFWVELDGVRMLFLGGIADFVVDSDELSGLGDIDVVVLPVGGHGVLDAAGAAKVARHLEAKLVIPSHFALPGLKTEFDPVEKFLKEMNSKLEPTDKLKVTVKDLPQDAIQAQCIMPSGALE